MIVATLVIILIILCCVHLLNEIENKEKWE